MAQVQMRTPKQVTRTQPRAIVKQKASPHVKKQAHQTQEQVAVEGKASMNPEERRRVIAEAAYFKAARRNFDGGKELDDWLEAEAEMARFFREA